MDLSSGSSNSSRNKPIGTRNMCNCGLPVKIMKSWTDKNPGRRFYGCELYRARNHCQFFCWFDEEEVSGWPKRALIEARDEIREKNRVIEQLTKTTIELRSELEKYQIEISSIDSEDEANVDKETKSVGELEWERKLVDIEAIVYHQRMIITGLTGFLICAFEAFLFT